MEDRGLKRPEVNDITPADKRPCSSWDCKPSSSNSPPCSSWDCKPSSSNSPPQSMVNSTTTATEIHERDSAAGPSSSVSVSAQSEGDVERDSYGSCDSDDEYEDDNHHHSHGPLEDIQRQRSYGDEVKIKTILPNLNGGIDPSVQLVSLTELCEVLSFSVGGSISCSTADMLVPLLVNLAKDETSPDIMLFAIRAMTYLFDVYPKAAVSLVRHEAVPALCQRLMIIEYMDVAEQCLLALQKISRDEPVACLHSGAIMAVLSYVDFFSTSMQRNAMSTVVNICEKLPSVSFTQIIEPVPRFCALLQYEDRQLVENVATCLIRIADKLKDSPDMLNELCKRELIHQITHIIAFKSQTTLSQPTYSGLIGLLAKLAAQSSNAVKELLNLDIGNVVKDILANNELQQGMPSHAAKNNCNEVHEILCLLNEILPHTVRDQEDQLSSAKESILVDQPEAVNKLGMSILPALVQIVNSGANLYVCYGCVLIISKLVHFSKPEVLLELVTTSKLPSFLTGVFIRKDCHMLTLALKITETLLQKLSDSLITSLAKERVFFAIEALIHHEKSSEFVSSRTSDTPSHGKRKGGCLCYAYNSNEPYTEGKTCKLDSKSVQDVAQRIRTNYYRSEFNNLESAVTTVLQNLRIISAELNSLVEISLREGESAEVVGRFDSLLRLMMAQIGRDEFVSTFELVESGVTKALVNFLSGGLYYEEKSIPHHPGITAHRSAIICKRFELFATVVSCSSSSFDSKKHPMSFLVGKLQNALSTVESFPIVVGNVTKLKSSYVRIPHGKRTVHSSLKVLFKRVEDEIDLPDYSGVTTVDPFCSLETIGRFLLPLVSKEGVNLSRDQNSPDDDFVNPVPMKIDDLSHSMQKVQDTGAEQTSTTTHLRGLDLGGSKSSVEVHNTNNEASIHSLGVDVVREKYGYENAPVSSPSTNGQSELSSSQTTSSGLAFYLDGVELENSSTLYQEIIQRKMDSQDELLNSTQLWGEVYTVGFRRMPKDHNHNKKASSDESISVASDEREKFTFLSRMVFQPSALELEKSSTGDLLCLLRILETMNRFASHLSHHRTVNMFVEGKCDDLIKSRVFVATISQSEFVNNKLSEKLEQQMLDMLTVSTGAMPLWCNRLMITYPFVFSYETRSKYFQLAAFGRRHVASRSSSSPDSGSSNLPPERRHSNSGSLPRQKFKVSRDMILKSATQMMENHAHQKVVLEVEYSEEVGTGQGPTSEFYTLVCLEFQKPGMGMWRSDQKSSAEGKNIQSLESVMTNSAAGLFPRPLKELEITDTVKNFSLLGKIVAKAIQDGRVLDIPFSRAFYKLILGQELTLYDIQSFDPELGETLLEFHAISRRHKSLKSSCEKGDLSFRGMQIDDLVLDFTLPGYPDYLLKSGGNQLMVTIGNLEQYVELVLDATLNTGIQRQVEAFKSGFDQVFPIKHLQIFTEAELERLLCGEHDSWMSDEALEHIKLDHGYTSTSTSILHLLEIIQEFDYEQRRLFLQFMTGAPRLPPGGLAALRPRLTIVRKHSCNSPDEDLPSVMTCANYLKLPLYSSKEKMKEKLLYAITEGQGSFHLS